MADETRCPMCSKTNPADATTCRHCGARLVPLGGTPAPASGTPASDPADWLKGLRITPGDDAASAASPADDIPDWLADVRGFSDSAPAAGAASSAPAADDDLPDWMSGAAPTNASAPAAGLAGMDDWLSTLREPEEPAPLSSSAPAAPVGEPEGEDNWLSSLQSWSTPESTSGFDTPTGFDTPAQPSAPAPEAASFATGQDDLSSWLSSLDSSDGPAAPMVPEVSDLPAAAAAQPDAAPEPDFNWAAQFSQPAAPAPQERSLEDWLSEDLDSPAQPAEIPPSPDWLSAGFGAEPASQASTASQEAGNDLPDWLSGLSGQDEPAAPSPAAADDDFSSWLTEGSWTDTTQAAQGADIAPIAKPAPSVANAEPAAKANTPDWMASFGADASSEQPAASVANAAPASDDFSAWFSAEQPAQPAASEASASAAIPDFAAMFGEKPGEVSPEDPWIENIQAQLPEQPASEPAPAEKSEPVPDWLAAFAVAGTILSEPAPAEAAEVPFIDPQQPSWLKSVGVSKEPSEQAGPPALFEEMPQAQPDLATGTPFNVDLPDWLDNPQLSPAHADAEASEEGETLAPAELPGWVQEMRPLESVIPGQEVANTADQQRVEKAGPLAGMRGVLPSEEPAAHFRKLPAYSSKLRVSERQHLHAGLLQKVLDAETQPTAITMESSGAPQTIYRLVIALVLTLALLMGLIFKDVSLFPAPVPSSADKGLLNLFKEIESIPAGAPVLVAVDYEAALSGEMRYAASSVLEHLMARGAKLIIVSTVPAGPVLANDLLVSVRQGRPTYDLNTSSINLGYLPGGATSLLEFAERPNVAAPVDQNGDPAWESPVLQGVQTIQDFKMVLVLTDSVETGRAWVEQVQPVLGNVPLSMVSSAQAGPLLQPYLDAGQIKGLVNGLMGGAMYEQQYGKLNLASKDWNAYQLGYTAGILLLVLGGVFSALRRVVQKPQKARV
jgi:hypothetical protein